MKALGKDRYFALFALFDLFFRMWFLEAFLNCIEVLVDEPDFLILLAVAL